MKDFPQSGLVFLVNVLNKILYTKVSDKMAYANCANPYQTASEGAV